MCSLLLPVDHVVGDKVAADARTQACRRRPAIPADKMALDIGPETIELFAEEIGAGKTIVWNGPMGVFEIDAIRQRHHEDRRGGGRERRGAITIVGGGDSVAAVKAPAWPTRSRTSPPAAELRWNSSKARSCRAWKR